MEQFVGLDISQAMTHVCVVDSKGKRTWEGKCPTTPEAITKTIGSKAPGVQLIGMESGALSPYLWHELNARGLQWSASKPAMPITRSRSSSIKPTSTMLAALPTGADDFSRRSRSRA